MSASAAASAPPCISSASTPRVDFNGIGGNGVFGELTAGYDYMVSERFLLGGFIDANIGNIGPSISVPGADIDLTNAYGFDVGLRAGYPLEPEYARLCARRLHLAAFQA